MLSMQIWRYHFLPYIFKDIITEIFHNDNCHSSEMLNNRHTDYLFITGGIKVRQQPSVPPVMIKQLVKQQFHSILMYGFERMK